MRKRGMTVLLAVSCMWSVSVMAEHEVGGNVETYSYPSEEASEEVWESILGYSMKYDPKIFTLDDTEESDSFLYHTSEKLKAPVYIAVTAYPDMDAQTLAEGVAIQNDIEESEIQDTYFGADSMETKCVYAEQDIEGNDGEWITTMQVFYVIPKEEGSLLVEIMGYERMPAAAEGAFEKMTGSFRLTDLEDEH